MTSREWQNYIYQMLGIPPEHQKHQHPENNLSRTEQFRLHWGEKMQWLEKQIDEENQRRLAKGLAKMTTMEEFDFRPRSKRMPSLWEQNRAFEYSLIEANDVPLSDHQLIGQAERRERFFNS